MTPALKWLLYSVALTWLMLLMASLARTHGWTVPGMRLAFGNRDDLPEPTPLAARAERAARNMVENLVLFAALVLAAHAAARVDARVALGAEMFFWARLAYAPLYWAGVHYLRTLAWAIGVAGMGLIALALLA